MAVEILNAPWYELAALVVSAGSISGVAAMKLLTAGTKYGEIALTVNEMAKTMQQMRADIKDIQHHIYRSYSLTPEEARRFLHYHDAEGNVCYT